MRFHASLALTVALAGCGQSLPELPPAPAFVPPPQARNDQATPLMPVGQPPAQIPADLPPGAPAGAPLGTSRPGATANRYDTVGYAGWYQSPQLGAALAAVPMGAFVEVTSLDSGKTILLPVAEQMNPTDKVVGLATAAMKLLGATSLAALPVRVRLVVPSPADQAALRSGLSPAPRPDTPPSLLAPLRRQLPGAAPGAAAGASYAGPDGQAPRPTSGPGYYVQLGTFSARSNAEALAKASGGSVAQAGTFWRVQIGPYLDEKSAGRARDAAAGRGYGEGRIFRLP